MNLRIVISEGSTLEERYAASELRAAIAQYQGITPDIVYDSEAAADGDIYVGSTIYSKDMPTGDSYTVTSCGSRVCVCAGTAYGFEAAVKSVRDILQTNGGIIGGIELSGDGSSLRTCGLAREGQLRYLTYNVYGYNNSAHNTTATLRQPYQLSLLGSYDADILAFQEFSNNSEKKGVVRYRSEAFISGLKKLGYAEVGGGELLNAAGANFTPLFYKTKALSVIDSGYLLYSGANDVNSKSVTWAVFENGDTSRFIAMATHFMWNDKSLGEGVANLTRCSNANELVELIADIKAKHGELPVIVGGDLNCSEGRGDTAPLDILSCGGLTWAQGDVNAINSVNGHGAYATWDPVWQIFCDAPSHSSKDASFSIDHVWYSGMSIKLFATVTDRYACLSSDHCPKITDFSIN